MWDLNFRGLGLALQLLLLAPLCQPSVGKTTATATTDDLPHPWLTENRTATVLELVCRPPTNIKMDKIYGLELRFSRLAYRNMTLALMTTAMEIPRRAEVPDIARVSFNGNWNSPSLSVLMHFTSEDFGEYSCSGQYKEQGSTGSTASPHFNTNITVNGSRSQSHNEHNFEVRVIDVHEVLVTWRAPKGSKFIQARVSRTSVVKETGMELSASESLFTTSVEGSFVYNSKVTLLAKFQYPSQDGGNFSMRLYVKKLHHPYCRYSCDVVYTGCYGRDVQFCVCSRRNQDSVPESTPYQGALIAVSVILLVIVLTVLVLYTLHKTGKSCACLNKFMASPADNDQLNSPNGDNREGQTSGSGTHPQERPNDPSEQNRPPARSAQNDKPQSSTPPSEGIGPSHAEEKAKTRSNEQTTVASPHPAASSGDNNPTPTDDGSGADVSLLHLQHRSEDQLQTKDNSLLDDSLPAEETTEIGPDTHSNPVQSKSDKEDDKEVEAPENRRVKDTVCPQSGRQSSETGDEMEYLLPKTST